MSQKTALVCIGCPIGCPLQLVHVGDRIEEITGHECNRGAKYARQEFADPRRQLSTTVAVEDGLWERLPVKVVGPVKKNRIMDAARRIHGLRVRAPVASGQVLLETKLGDELITVVATRSMPAKRTA